jgi:zinc-ribbon domain
VDQEFIEQQRELLSLHRRSLVFYLKQLAQLGEAYAPAGLLHSITEARQNIRAVKRSLRQMNVDVEDIFIDEEDKSTSLIFGGEQGDQITTVYQGFWNKIEEIHIMVRVSMIDKELFNKSIQGLNTFAIRNSLSIDEEDQILANKYLKALYKLKILVDERGNADERESMAITGALSADDFQSVVEFRELIEQLDNARDTLYERVKSKIHKPTHTKEARQSYCTRCGHALRPSAKYCSRCGHRRRDADTANDRAQS